MFTSPPFFFTMIDRATVLRGDMSKLPSAVCSQDHSQMEAQTLATKRSWELAAFSAKVLRLRTSPMKSQMSSILYLLTTLPLLMRSKMLLRSSSVRRV